VYRRGFRSTNRQPSTNGLTASENAPPSDRQRPHNGPRSRRRRLNVEGAFPLLLIGSVLLVYAAILSNQEISSPSGQLPLWGLIGGVGTVIVGAGIYSTFLAPPAIPAGDLAPDWVMVPKAEWDDLRARPPVGDRPRTSTPEPPWWEGPPDHSVGSVSHTPESQGIGEEAPPTPARSASLGPRPSSILPEAGKPATSAAHPPFRSPSSRVVPPAQPAPPSLRRGFTTEFMETLAELEALADRELKPLPGSPRRARVGEARSCADCKGEIPSRERTPNRCTGCGRALCVDCAMSSQLEDAELRCIECRVRSP